MTNTLCPFSAHWRVSLRFQQCTPGTCSCRRGSFIFGHRCLSKDCLTLHEASWSQCDDSFPPWSPRLPQLSVIFLCSLRKTTVRVSQLCGPCSSWLEWRSSAQPLAPGLGGVPNCWVDPHRKISVKHITFCSGHQQFLHDHDSGTCNVEIVYSRIFGSRGWNPHLVAAASHIVAMCSSVWHVPCCVCWLLQHFR